MSLKTLYFYQDKGASKDSFDQFQKAFSIYPKHHLYALHKISAQEIIESEHWKKTPLLIFPGGADIPYHKKLKGKGSHQIRSYVEKGGSYLGICAGAYFASSEILFEKGKEHEVYEQRELAFFSKTAFGTVYTDPPFSYQGHESARAAQIRFKKDLLEVYYNGGCTFLKAKADPKTQIWATYADIENQPPAIIECRVQKGCALLSGVHFEMLPQYVLEKKELASFLEKSEIKRQKLFNTIMDYLL